MKPRAMSEWILPAASTARGALAHGPGARLDGAGGEERDQAERAEAGARQARHAGLVESEIGEEGRAVVGILELGQLGLEARRDRDDLGAVLRRVGGQRRDALGLAGLARRWRRRSRAWS